MPIRKLLQRSSAGVVHRRSCSIHLIAPGGSTKRTGNLRGQSVGIDALRRHFYHCARNPLLSSGFKKRSSARREPSVPAPPDASRERQQLLVVRWPTTDDVSYCFGTPGRNA